MIDHEKYIGAQAIMKSLIESGEAKDMEVMFGKFDACVKKMEEYAKPAYVANAAAYGDSNQYSNPILGAVGVDSRPYTATNRDNVAQTPPSGRKFVFCSEKQSKRAYALMKASGWQDYQVRSLANKYGFQNTKKIPVGVYEKFCNDLQMGPGNLNESSSHLQPIESAEIVEDQPPF